MNILFESEINKINALDDSIEPEIMLGVDQRKEKETTTNENRNTTEETPPKKKKKSNNELLNFLKLKEENKEKRHAEKVKFAYDVDRCYKKK